MSDPAIEIDKLTHCYGERTALDDLSFTVAGGEVVALLGPNGGGKTTLFRILSTLMLPTSGTARIAGCDVRKQPAEVRRQIGVTFQSASLDPKLTVHENLTVHGHLYGMTGQALRARIDELLGTFDIADRARDYCEILSGGLRRRVEIAKSIMHRPNVLLMDEPSTGLDPAARRDVRRVFERLSGQGVTVFLTTHIMEEAERCDRVAIIERGKLVDIDKPAALCRSIGGDVITFETDMPDELAAHIGESATVGDGCVRVEHEAGHKLAASVIDSFEGRVRAVHVGQPTLADVFLSRTGRQLDDEHGDGELE